VKYVERKATTMSKLRKESSACRAIKTLNSKKQRRKLRQSLRRAVEAYNYNEPLSINFEEDPCGKW